MGPPGAGKGTQAKILAKKYNLLHLSTGDILRHEIDKKTEIGLEAQSYMNKGNLVPDNVLLTIVNNALTALKDSGVILDGFPRTVPQAEGLDNFLDEMNQKINAVVSIELDDESIIKRLSSRRFCNECGNITNLLFNPPKIDDQCDKCSGLLLQRSDDSKEVIIERLEVYNLSLIHI